MDLRTGQPLWLSLTKPPVYPKLARNITCDIAIIGSGITGSLIAFELARRGLPPVVVDRRAPCLGSSAACTALVQYEIDRPMLEVARLLGREHAEAAYRSCRRALRDLSLLDGELNHSLNLIETPSLYLAKKTRDVLSLRQEAAARRSIGLDVRFLSGKSLKREFRIDRPAALLSSVAYSLDPVVLVSRLLAAAAEKGARVFSKSPVAIELTDGPYQALHTPEGRTIRCKALVLAAGYETPEQFKLIHPLCKLRSTYAFASAPASPADLWPRRALLWEACDPYLYARVTPDHRVIVGGEDVKIVNAEARDALLPRKLKRLVKGIGGLFPRLSLVPEYAWTGTFAQTRDGLPYIGPHPAYPGCYFALGYGGNGITFSVLASQIIADEIQGKANPDARLFGFDRRGKPR